ncbi:ABC transporter [Lysinibacillus contaminans]|uniref:ABC transporter n=1 Tax=Lysinibacillus contaminans TaxID=1293441 RepID=A0ABR5JW63_9BACI|nr:ABC transporter permease [Lysinibacillus contaminans]KOS66368.1 ABC transporter [Lysinibacillus contaminans]
MNISMTRIQAIFMKDYKEFSRNYAVSIMVLLPLILAVGYNITGASDIQTYMMPINMTFALVTAYVQCCLIAEEKEKNTLRSLMLSPASLGDILVGKSLFVFVLSSAVVALTIYLLGYEPANLLLLSIALLLSTIFYIAIGTFCGLFTKTIMEASIIILPVMVIFTVGPFAFAMSEVYPIFQIAEWLPSSQLNLLAEALEGNYSSTDVIIPFVTITAWTLFTWLVTAFVYKKRMVD